MSLDSLIEDTKAFVGNSYSLYRNPCGMISFGKDSMVMIHLILQMGYRPPVVFYSDPFAAHKYLFPRAMMAAWGLTVHHYPAFENSILWGKNIPALVSIYKTGDKSGMMIPKNIDEYSDGRDKSKFVCGLDYLSQPRGQMEYPFDAIFIGHKDADIDNVFGEVKLHEQNSKQEHGPDWLFPLKNWTDENVWDYIDRFDVPMQEDRYDVCSRTERPDKTNNSDWVQACIRCFDKRLTSQTAICPKTEKSVPMVTSRVPECNYRPTHFHSDI